MAERTWTSISEDDTVAAGSHTGLVNIWELIPIYELAPAYYYTHPGGKVNKELLSIAIILVFAQFEAQIFIKYAL